MPDLRVLARRPDPRRDAALDFALRSLGVRFHRIDTDDELAGPCLVLGDSAPRPDAVVIVDRATDVLWPEVLKGRIEPRSLDGLIPFDLISAIASFLDDTAEADAIARPGALDAHGRLSWAESEIARRGFGDEPVVNRYVQFLGEMLRTRLGIEGRPRWPNGCVAAIGLSHDVDHPDRYALLESAWRPWRFRRAPRTYARRSMELVRRRRRDHDRRDFWLFDAVARSERDRGFRSTFFFATVPFHRASGSAEDVAYDVHEPRYRAAIRTLRGEGFEIGLHASYRAFEDPERFADERRTLAIVAGTEIRGLRHHYWHLGPDVTATLRAHEAAGFAYDSSIAFNDHVGFRRGVALPFHAWDAMLERPLRVLELPTFCMDGNLFYRSADVDAAVTTVDRAIAAIVATGGMASIDWHIQTSYPGNDEFRAWGEAYQAILDRLAARPDVWTTDLGTIERWVRERDAASDAGAPADPSETLAGAAR